MPLPAYRAKQSTATTGTGTMILAAAAATGRSLLAAYGAAARRVQYVVSWASGFEIGFGDYDGGTPGQLTRATVLASSNAGALVSLPAGIKDVFIALVPGQRELLPFAGNLTVTAADLGSLAVFSGSAAATLSLPAVNTVPPGAGVLVRNGGTGLLTVDPSGAELVDGLTVLQLPPGTGCELVRNGAGWDAPGAPAGWCDIRRANVSGVASVDFALPAGFDAYRISAPYFGFAAQTPLYARTSNDGGVTFAAAGTDYGYSMIYTQSGGPGNNITVVTSQIDLSGLLTNADFRNQIQEIRINPGSASLPCTITALLGVIDTGPQYRITASHGSRSANGLVNGIRLLGTANVTGIFLLEGHLA